MHCRRGTRGLSSTEVTLLMTFIILILVQIQVVRGKEEDKGSQQTTNEEWRQERGNVQEFYK